VYKRQRSKSSKGRAVMLLSASSSASFMMNLLWWKVRDGSNETIQYQI
jgi:hypothetical protein